MGAWTSYIIQVSMEPHGKSRQLKFSYVMCGLNELIDEKYLAPWLKHESTQTCSLIYII